MHAHARMTAVIAAMMLASIGCKKDQNKKAPPVAAGDDAATAVEPVAVAGLDRAGLEAIEATMNTAIEGGATLDQVTAQVTASLGKPTLIEPAQGDERRTTWAVVTEDGCSELTVRLRNGKAFVERDDRDRVTTHLEIFYACTDAARGVAQGRRYVAAYDQIGAAEPDQVVAALEPTLGRPTIQAEQGEVKQLVWASVSAERCDYAIATIENGSTDARSAAVRPGTPWHAECVDWAAGRPTSLWAEDINDAALYAKLTVATNPHRARVAADMMDEARDATIDLDEPAARKELLRRLGKPAVEVDRTIGWAVTDGTTCARLWWFGDEDRDSDSSSSDDYEAECAEMARGDVGPGIMGRLYGRLPDDMTADQTLAWLVAHLGKPSVDGIEDNDAVRRWAEVQGKTCVFLELSIDEDKQGSFDRGETTAEDDAEAHAACTAWAAGKQPPPA